VHRHHQVRLEVLGLQGFLPRTRSHDTRLPADVGHLFCGLRRHQDHLRGSSARNSNSPNSSRAEAWGSCGQSRRQGKGEGVVSSCSAERLPTGGEGTPLGTAYNVCSDRWGDEYDVYDAPVGHQDEVHGALRQQYSRLAPLTMQSPCRLKHGTSLDTCTLLTPRGQYTEQRVSGLFTVVCSRASWALRM